VKSKYDVTIIIVNYNGKRFLNNLFLSLSTMKIEQLKYEIVLVDNASGDSSIEFVKENFGNLINLKIVESNENLGFAAGNNRGVEYAEGEYIVFLNNDTEVDKNWLISLYNFMLANPKCGMANSKLLFFYDFIKLRFSTSDRIIISSKLIINNREYNFDSKFCKNVICNSQELICFGNSEIYVPLLDGENAYLFDIEIVDNFGNDNKLISCGKEWLLAKGEIRLSFSIKEIQLNKIVLVQNAGSGVNANYDGYDIGFCEQDGNDYRKKYEIVGGCGASIIMLREDFINIGKFDERYFMYYEDMDLSFRLRKSGKIIMFCPESIVRHIHTGSSKEWSPFFCYQTSRNKLLFIYKNISKVKYLIYLFKQFAIAIKNKNSFQKQGCIDSLRIVLGYKNIQFRN
jgi:GT2 family glycosyltransferase